MILNLAHRGFSGRFPENTLLAFDEAMKVGADGFECDLRMTADGRIVVFHDDDLKRLCGIKGSVERSTWQELQNIKILGQESLPLLEDVLDSFHTTMINLELKKSERVADFVEAVLRTLTKVRPRGEILFSSFEPEILSALKVMDPERKLGKWGVLVDAKNISRLPESLNVFAPDTWNVPRQIFNQPWAQRWKGLKIPPLYLWTLDEPDLWASAVRSELPIRAIITNFPDRLSSWFKSRP